MAHKEGRCCEETWGDDEERPGQILPSQLSEGTNPAIAMILDFLPPEQ